MYLCSVRLTPCNLNTLIQASYLLTYLFLNGPGRHKTGPPESGSQRIRKISVDFCLFDLRDPKHPKNFTGEIRETKEHVEDQVALAYKAIQGHSSRSRFRQYFSWIPRLCRK